MRRAALASAILMLLTLAIAPRFGANVALPAAEMPSPVPAATLQPAWLTYHLDNARTGNDTTEGTVTGVSALWTATLAGGGNTLDGQLYAAPLIYGTSVYVATENNTVYAFDTATGAEQWDVHFGAPRPANQMPCGNISPNVGITSTPVIDPNGAAGHGIIYSAAMTSEPHYRLYGIDLVTHAVVVNTIIDAGRINVENQRGALGLANGNVYIPFGGRAGDCSDFDGTPYFGIVVGVPTNGAAHFSFAATDTPLGGIWAPGGMSIDGSGNVYVSLGNGNGPKSESVFKLSPDLQILKQWRPSNHQYLDDNDVDVGSITPALVGGGDVFQNGKFGKAFMLDSNLVQQTADPGYSACGSLSSNASFGAMAYSSPYIYVPCANGLWAVTQSGHSVSPLFHALTTFAGPPIVAGGLVWTMSQGHLYGFNQVTGAGVVNVTVDAGGMSRFESAATGGGRIFAPGGSLLKAYTLNHGCDTVSLAAAPPSTQSAGLSVTFTANATMTSTCTTPNYEFWLRSPAGVWTLKQGFSATTTWTWDTTGQKPGAGWVVHVWANQQGDPTTTYETLGSLNYTLTGCSSAGLTPSAPTQAAGSTVNFTATSSGCPNPVYEYWVKLLNGKWYMKRAFSSDPTWAWNTSGLPPGTYTVHAWANQQGAYTGALQATGSSTVKLTGCTSASLSPNSGSAPVGTPVTFTASSGGCPNPVYEFWLEDTKGKWHLMRGFGANTWTWNNAGWGKGLYHFSVWAINQGSYAGRPQAYGAGTYRLT